MASTDSTTFPVKGQAYRVYGVIKSSATGNPITGGLTTLTVTISKDGAAFGSPGGTITEIGSAGYFYVDLTVADMTANCVIVHITAANANAVYQSIILSPIDLSETTDHAYDHTVKKLEQFIAQGHAYLLSAQQMTAEGAQTLYKADGTTALASRTFTVVDGVSTTTRMG